MIFEKTDISPTSIAISVDIDSGPFPTICVTQFLTSAHKPREVGHVTDSQLRNSGSTKIAPPITVTHEDIRGFTEALGLAHAAPGRCSTILMFELYARTLFPVPVPVDPHKITAEILALEGLGCLVGTKPAEQFKHPPLRGLWKKHYLVSGLPSLVTNIQIGFGRRRKALTDIIAQHWNPETAHLPPEVVSQNLANGVVGLYAERSRDQKLTGEWIVYAQHEGRNYYLCLALHDEGDAAIFDRIKNSCVDEFPFLHSQLGLGSSDAG